MKKEQMSEKRRVCHPADDTDNIRVDPEFQALIPPLSRGELVELHQSLDTEGCRDSLIVWKGENTLVDGHNRILWCRETNHPFSVVEKEFQDREAVKAF